MPVINVETGEERDHTPEEKRQIQAESEAARNRVPQSVHRSRLKIALLRAGKLDDVERTVAGRDREQRLLWTDNHEFRRDDPFLATLAAANSIDLDAIFRAAAQI